MSKEDLTLLEQLGGVESPAAETADTSRTAGADALARAQQILESQSLKEQVAPVQDDVGIQEVAVSSQQVHDAAKRDLDFLAALIMPLVFEFGFPPVFKSVWHWLISNAHESRVFPRLALGLPRGFGKTTLIKIFVVYCILFTNKKFILIVANTAGLAQNILADIMDMLNEQNVRRAFGDWSIGVEKDTQELKKFGFRGRNITLAALGAEGSLRGLNLKNERPDIMIFEDIQSREQADSKIQSYNLETWMVGTAMKAKSPKGCMFLFVGNMYPTDHSILRKLKHNPTWIKYIAGGILVNDEGEMESLWEELQPLHQLLEEFENDLSMGRPEIFDAEVLNDENASMNKLVDVSSLPLPPMDDGDISAGKFIVIDPATDKPDSDEVSIGYFEVHDTKPVLMDLKEDRYSPGETVRQALVMGLEHGCPLIFVESNAYQYTLLYWFEFICEQMGVTGFHFEPIYSGSKSKNSRILNMFKGLTAGELYLAKPVRPAVFSQIVSFNPLKRDNTDGLLDLLTYAARVISEFMGLLMSYTTLEQQEFDSAEVIEYNTEF